MNTRCATLLTSLAVAALTSTANAGVSFSEGFDDINTLIPAGWFTQNNSEPIGTTGWFQGSDTVFPSQTGDPTSYIGANFNNASDGPLGPDTISNWLLTPELSLENGDVVSFFTRTVAGSIFPDRLQVRLSTAGPSVNVGLFSTDVGDFSTLLLDINPSYTVGGYPEAWTQFDITLSGLAGPATSGRIAFRYFVEDGGPIGANSNYIGIDTFSYTAIPSPAVLATLGLAGLTLRRRRRN